MDEHSKRIYSQSGSATSAYARHLQQADAYVRYYGGERPALDKFRTEREILEDNHRFIRDDDELPQDHPIEMNEERRLARKYYDSLFREFALIDLSRWREKQVAMRWRTKAEVLSGKGQFTCASLHCSRGDHIIDPTLDDRQNDQGDKLKNFELNFGYLEDDVKKNALVKVHTCRKCAKKLHEAQRKEGEKDRRHRKRRHSRTSNTSRSCSREESKRQGEDVDESYDSTKDYTSTARSRRRSRIRSRSPSKGC
ncbi:MAG: hypothetical protein M1827_005092 [Pycnora praestabilis]|nr:MAG: hypothetical protein M1827_005092 [Pycnora praestabilis]